MYPLRLISLALALLAVASPAFAQANNNYNVSWAALNPGNDWAAQVLQSLFPMYGAGNAPPTGSEATVIGQIVGQFTGFVAAIAAAFVAYNTIMNIHRAAESSRLLGANNTWMFVVRVGFAGIMMFPLGNGFSAGQGLVYQSAMWGIGMAKVLYQNAVQAVGPDAITIARPMIPGSEKVVLGLISNELCMDLVNLAANSNGMVPAPTAIVGTYPSGGGYSTLNYNLSTGNQSGTPVCGTVTVQTPNANQSKIAGVSIDMAAVQQAALNDVLTGTIRPQVQTVAQQLWQTKTVASLVPIQGILTSATAAYTNELSSAATSIQSAVNAALAAQAQQARNGTTSDLLTGEIQQSSLGWTGAGAYYMEIAKANASTMSLLSATPALTPPSYEGLGPALSQDLAPLVASASDFLNTLMVSVNTQDPSAPPTGMPQTLAGAEAGQNAGMLTRIFDAMNLSTPLLNTITGFITPTAAMWADPFGGLMNMGQTLINASLLALIGAAALSSATISTGSAIFNFLTGNWGAAAATVALHAIMSFLAGPVFVGVLGLMIPGIIIAYVLPMIPWVLWMAGVCGWIILVCEAMIAVPLWMLAHMTVGGDGLHGRAIEGWGLLFNVVFRPTLMVIGLFLGYFVFACMSYLIRQTFGIAAGFALSNGWVVTNFIGVAVLLNIFVMTHITAALMSFRLVALMPHHLPRLLGFSPANRVDTEAFYSQAAMQPGGQIAGGSHKALIEGGADFRGRMKQLSGDSPRRISGPQSEESNNGAMDSTLHAATDTTPGGEENEDV